MARWNANIEGVDVDNASAAITALVAATATQYRQAADEQDFQNK